MGLRKLPDTFTEEGVTMLSSVLNSDTAIEVNIQVIRIFIRIREVLLTHSDILYKLEQIENKLLRNDEKAQQYEADIEVIFDALKGLLSAEQTTRELVGYKTA
jgi:hypothetical protein